MKIMGLARLLVLFLLVTVSVVASASSGITLYGVTVSNTFFGSLYCFFSAFYYSSRAYSFRRHMLTWWMIGLLLSIAFLVISIILVKTFLPFVNLFSENIISMIVGIFFTLVVANILVSKFDTNVLTTVCLMAAIPVILAAYLSVFSLYDDNESIITEKDEANPVPKLRKIILSKSRTESVEYKEVSSAKKRTSTRIAIRADLKKPVANKPVANKPVVDKSNRPGKRMVKLERLNSKQAVISRVRRARRVVTGRSKQLKYGASGGNWVVQVASFSVQNNAHRLRSRLGKYGYNVYISRENRVNRHMYRVRVGPIPLKSEVDRLIQKLVSEQNLNGIVLRRR